MMDDVSTGPAPAASPAAPSATSTEQLHAMWRGQQVVWHALFAVLVAITAGLVVLQSSPTWPWQLGLLAALATAYVVWGPRALCEGGRATWIYLSIAWLVFFGIAIIDAQAQVWLLSFAVFPQTWAMLGRRAAVLTTVGILAFCGIRVAQVGATDSALAAIGVTALIMTTLSVALGLFIQRILSEASSRAQALDELRRAQEGLAAAERTAGVYAERARLSREIHDTLAQGFTSVVTLARAADAALDRGDLIAARDRLALLEQTASENLAEARLMVTELSPGHLQSWTLGEALERVAARVSSESGIEGAVRIEGVPIAAAANAEVVILRTAQEALANVRRHSGATHFAVALSYDDPDQLTLEVTDDGCGFDPGVPRADAGFGLAGARTRAAELGAELEIDSSPGAGTRLRLMVPR